MEFQCMKETTKTEKNQDRCFVAVFNFYLLLIVLLQASKQSIDRFIFNLFIVVL